MAEVKSILAEAPSPAGTPWAPLSRGEALGRDFATAVVVFHEAVARRVGMTAADRKCLSVLCELGETTPKRLAEATGLSTGAITGVLDRLETSGYAARRPNPDDRRSLLVRALNMEAVTEVIAPIFASLGGAMAELTARYTPEQLVAIADYLTRTTQVLKSQTEKLERETPPSKRGEPNP